MLAPIPSSPSPRIMKLPETEKGMAINPRTKSLAPMRSALSATAKIDKYTANIQMATLNNRANNAISMGIATGAAQMASSAILRVPMRTGFSNEDSSSSFLSSRLELRSLAASFGVPSYSISFC